MKNDLKAIVEALEKKIGKKIRLEHGKIHLEHGKKPSQQTLNRLALLAGFQSWEDFRDALHGSGDGLVNYSSGE